LEPAGVGALMALLEERKRKLAAEGLFDEARKQLLPFLPDVIGVITSPTGAVIRDILHRLADRLPRRAGGSPAEGRGGGRGGQGRPSAASMRCPRPDGRRGRTSSSWRAAAARSRICGRSTRRSWRGRRPRA